MVEVTDRNGAQRQVKGVVTGAAGLRGAIGLEHLPRASELGHDPRRVVPCDMVGDAAQGIVPRRVGPREQRRQGIRPCAVPGARPHHGCRHLVLNHHFPDIAHALRRSPVFTVRCRRRDPRRDLIFGKALLNELVQRHHPMRMPWPGAERRALPGRVGRSTRPAPPATGTAISDRRSPPGEHPRRLGRGRVRHKPHLATLAVTTRAGVSVKIERRVIVIDADDIDSESRFWAGLLGGVTTRDDA